MLRVLIVDDEAIVRRGLRKTIEWEKNGFELIGEADDGITAIELTKSLKPDVIITDVCMPIMDGLEYIKDLQADGCKSKIIILSGHDNFDFAQKAIKYGIFSYILKPVDNKILINILLKIKKTIEFEKKNNREINQLKKVVKDNYIKLKEDFLFKLIKGNYEKEENLDDMLEYFDIGDINKLHGIMVVEIDNYSLAFKSLTEEKRQINKFMIVNICQKILQEYGSGYAFNGEREHTVVIFNFAYNKSEMEKYRLSLTIGERIKKKINDHLELTVSIGISRSNNGMDNLKNSYMEALEAVAYKSWIGKNSIIFFKDINAMECKTFEYPYEIEQAILAGLKRNSIDCVQQAVDEYFDYILKYKNLPMQYIKKQVLALVFMIDRNMLKSGIETDAVFGEPFIPNKFISGYETINDLRDYLMSILKKINSFIREKKHNKFRMEISRALDYINLNCNKHIDLNVVAEYVHLSPYYLSRLFKEQTGMNFVDCLNKIRIEKAKELLENGKFKVFEVAERVGYKDNAYFGQMFKKHVGISPGSYKKNK